MTTVTLISDITFAHADGTDLQLDLSRPDIEGSVPVVIYLHGGLGARRQNNRCPNASKALRQAIFGDTGPQACSPRLAYQMIYESIEYAAQFGFSPHKDFELTQHMLAPRGDFNASYKLEFGQKGKPLLSPWPFRFFLCYKEEMSSTLRTE